MVNIKAGQILYVPMGWITFPFHVGLQSNMETTHVFTLALFVESCKQGLDGVTQKAIKDYNADKFGASTEKLWVDRASAFNTFWQ